MRILEVAFDEYVRRPENQQNTNVLRLVRENEIGIAATVDTLDECPAGIRATKIVVTLAGKKTTYSSLYPWFMVKDVKYEPVVEEPKSAPAVKKSA